MLVTAEYNHGYPATLKNAIDHAFCEFRRKPVAFVGYGNVGGARLTSVDLLFRRPREPSMIHRWR